MWVTFLLIQLASHPEFSTKKSHCFTTTVLIELASKAAVSVCVRAFSAMSSILLSSSAQGFTRRTVLTRNWSRQPCWNFCCAKKSISGLGAHTHMPTDVRLTKISDDKKRSFKPKKQWPSLLLYKIFLVIQLV